MNQRNAWNRSLLIMILINATNKVLRYENLKGNTYENLQYMTLMVMINMIPGSCENNIKFFYDAFISLLELFMTN